MNDQRETANRHVPPASALLPVRRRPYWQFATLALLAVLAAGLFGWRQFSRKHALSYTTATVDRGTVTRTVTATGTVNPVLTIIVGSYVSGVIQSLSCDFNTVVKAGQVCAKIDPRPYQAALDQYSGQLARDQAILAKDRVDLKRYQQLTVQDSIARQQTDDQFYTVQQDEGTVKLDEGLVQSAKRNLEYTDIISPVDGIVVSRNVTQGQTVASSFQTPTLFLIATDLKRMQVDTSTSESDIGQVKKGDKATFTVDAYPQRVFRGSVTQVRQSPQMVQNVVTYDAVVGVDNDDLALMPGMTASTQIVVAERPDALRVPDQALRYLPGGMSRARVPAGGAQVFILRGGSPVAVPVVVGLDDGNFSEIVKGDLHPGDTLIIEEQSVSGGLPLPRL